MSYEGIALALCDAGVSGKVQPFGGYIAVTFKGGDIELSYPLDNKHWTFEKAMKDYYERHVKGKTR